MDFFGAQDRARRKTWHLGLLFAAAVIALILATNLLIALVAAFTTTGFSINPSAVLSTTSYQTWFGISALVIFVIAAASLYKYHVVRSGGRAIAEMLGARQIDPSTTDFAERRMLNVVEEMAIASAISVPPVYLIEEAAINAFAAGLGTDDAIIGVTRGTLETLDREELQGVIGHEFSHILNGDTRINLRLIALLHGILFLGLIGRAVLRGGGRGNKRGSGGVVLILGVGLLAIGYAGTFFGNLIKAAVSRQREFLADAAAVQFTRNPGGIANALKKIGGSGQGSRLAAPHTAEVSHLFFGQAVGFAINRLFATHPPLAQRIAAIEPRWDGQFIATDAAAVSARLTDEVNALAGDGHESVVSQVGNPSTTNLSRAIARIGAIPEPLAHAARDRADAFALLHAVFLSTESDIKDRQLNLLRIGLGTDTIGRILALQVDALDPIQRLTLVQLAAPALKSVSDAQFRALVANIASLVRADSRIDLSEWVLHRIVLKELTPHFVARKRQRDRPPSQQAETAAVTAVLSAMAKYGHGDQAAAFAAGAAAFDRPLTFDRTEDPNFRRLNDALRALRQISPLDKPRHIKAYAACALHDGATTEQRALLAGIAAALDCPLPPDFTIAT